MDGAPRGLSGVQYMLMGTSMSMTASEWMLLIVGVVLTLVVGVVMLTYFIREQRREMRDRDDS